MGFVTGSYMATRTRTLTYPCLKPVTISSHTLSDYNIQKESTSRLLLPPPILHPLSSLLTPFVTNVSFSPASISRTAVLSWTTTSRRSLLLVYSSLLPFFIPLPLRWSTTPYFHHQAACGWLYSQLQCPEGVYLHLLLRLCSIVANNTLLTTI